MNVLTLKRWIVAGLSLATLALVGCESIQEDETTSSSSGGSDKIKVTLSLSSSQVSSTTPVVATATVKKADGTVAANALVQFSVSSAGLARLSPSNGSTLTNGSGVATVTLVPGAESGAGTLTAVTSVTVDGVTETASASVNFEATGGAVEKPVMTLSLSSSQVSSSTPVIATASVKNADGSPAANALVQFSVNEAVLVTLSPSNGSTLTNNAGVAQVTLTPGTESGAGTLTAVASVTSGGVTEVASGSVNFQSTAPGQTAKSITLDPLVLGAANLSAYGTTSVSATVRENGVVYLTPVSLKFTSNCVVSGKAELPVTVSTINGVATASYKDNGCAGTDTIQVSADGITSVQSAQIVVTAPSIGSIQFVGASPTNISLKGTGGVGRQETSKVTFKIVDQASKPIKATVDFQLSTTVGGVSLSAASAESDSVTGEVSTYVQAGTIATPVRVTATVRGSSPVLVTQSDQLTISTGLPDQAHFSLSAVEHNIEGWDYDGETTRVTVRLADHFSNPVPDGTAISFIAEGAKIQSGCTTLGGECSVTFTSQNSRPSTGVDLGRVTVLAYADGEETFTDLDGDGYADSNAERIDNNGAGTDIGEAFVDYNENSVRDATEPFVDFNGDNLFSAADGKLNSTLCEKGNAICATRSTVHVWSQNAHLAAKPFVIVLADSQAGFTVRSVDGSGAVTVNPKNLYLGGCSATPGLSYLFDFTLFSNNNVVNPMPAGTRISVATSNGKLVGTTSWVVQSTTAPTQHGTFSVSDDASYDDGCTDSTLSGFLNITVTTPNNNITTYTVNMAN